MPRYIVAAFLLVWIAVPVRSFAADGAPAAGSTVEQPSSAAGKDLARPEPNACGCEGMAAGCCSPTATEQPAAKAAGCGCGGMKPAAAAK